MLKLTPVIIFKTQVNNCLTKLPILNLEGIKIEYNRDCAIAVSLDCGVIVTMKGKTTSVQVASTYRLYQLTRIYINIPYNLVFSSLEV